MEASTSRRSILRGALALPALAAPAALAVRILTPQEQIDEAFQHLQDVIRRVGPAGEIRTVVDVGRSDAGDIYMVALHKS